MSALRALAPAKINLGLFVGPTRAGDSRHELVSVMQSLSLADELELASAEREELHCPGLECAPEQNLAVRALAEFRLRTGWQGPPLRLSIDKRIPVAAGLAGGSADAAATLRLARAFSGAGSEQLLREIAASLGADVPAQLEPGRWLAGGAGERLQPLPAPAGELEVLLLPAAEGLSTAAVYARADALGLPRTREELARQRARIEQALAQGEPLPADPELLCNDLEPAAVALSPAIDRSLQAAREAGAQHAFVCGSGPTVAALFSGPGAQERARAGERALAARTPSVIGCRAVAAGFAAALASEGDLDPRLRNNPLR